MATSCSGIRTRRAGGASPAAVVTSCGPARGTTASTADRAGTAATGTAARTPPIGARCRPGYRSALEIWAQAPTIDAVGHAVTGEVIPRGKSGHHRARTVDNPDPAKAAGKCHRNDTAD